MEHGTCPKCPYRRGMETDAGMAAWLALRSGSAFRLAGMAGVPVGLDGAEIQRRARAAGADPDDALEIAMMAESAAVIAMAEHYKTTDG